MLGDQVPMDVQCAEEGPAPAMSRAEPGDQPQPCRPDWGMTVKGNPPISPFFSLGQPHMIDGGRVSTLYTLLAFALCFPFGGLSGSGDFRDQGTALTHSRFRELGWATAGGWWVPQARVRLAGRSWEPREPSVLLHSL